MIIDDWRILAVIPARAGSKGLPGKNLRILNGKPLIAWSIEAALNTKGIHKVVVSSDDEELLTISQNYGCSEVIHRPAKLATDEVTIEPVLIHAIDILPEEYSHVLLLQPTSPLRTTDDIENFLEFAQSKPGSSVISVVEASKSPFISYTLDEDGILVPLFPGERRQRRQDMPCVYVPNGALYIDSIDRLRKAGTFMTPDVNAYLMTWEHSVDIDTEQDFQYAEFLLKRNECMDNNNINN